MIPRRTGNGTAFGSRAATRLLIVGSLSFFTLLASSLGFLAPVQNSLLLVLSPLQAAVVGVANPVDDFFDHFGQSGEIQTENAQLRAENEQLNVQLAALREKEALFNSLSNVLDLKAGGSDDRLLPASVVARSSQRYQHAIAIDRGQRDGIASGMVVLAPGGSVIGRVSAVLADFAWVTLITDPSSRIPALVQDGRFDGILTGRTDDNMRLELLPQGTTVKPGSIVITSGLQGQLPKGLPLGRVIEVSGSDHDLFPTVAVEPLASMRSIENVVVLTSFVPGGVPPYRGPTDTRSSTTPAQAVPTQAPAQQGRPAESNLPGTSR